MPNFCVYCGTKLERWTSNDSWQYKTVCKCGAVCTFTYGDMMGGSANFIYWKKDNCNGGFYGLF